MVSYGARQHIRKNALQHLHQEMTITRKLGSFTLEESLAQLVKQGLVDRRRRARARGALGGAGTAARLAREPACGMEDASHEPYSSCVVTFRGGSSCRCFVEFLATTLAVMLVAPAAWAQQTHVINKSALDQAVQQRVSQDQADREALRSFLQNPTGEERRREGRSLDRERRSGAVDAAGRRAAPGRQPGPRRESGPRRRCDGRHHDDDDHHHPAGRHPDHRRRRLT